MFRIICSVIVVTAFVATLCVGFTSCSDKTQNDETSSVSVNDSSVTSADAATSYEGTEGITSESEFTRPSILEDLPESGLELPDDEWE